MRFLLNSFQNVDKSILVLRSLIRGGPSAIPLRAEHNLAVDKDEPIELENPYKKERQLCILCKYDIEPDYKNVRLLSQFQSRFTGRIYDRHITGLCKEKQERLLREILKAQNAGFMPYYHKEIKYVYDPKLYDIDNPFRPHRY
ncbi:hypothetical protein QAD02_006682 [Eretmocerus hayati]|uniref:Uncharacterized protein n=1 Tax=Eretmocerus hayati TaxID=131215 RepID=A0ACC2N1J7_9HYME|nr:hypothetical protein QAD02_006682 [Eretmocerus hayati]